VTTNVDTSPKNAEEAAIQAEDAVIGWNVVTRACHRTTQGASLTKQQSEVVPVVICSTRLFVVVTRTTSTTMSNSAAQLQRKVSYCICNDCLDLLSQRLPMRFKCLSSWHSSASKETKDCLSELLTLVYLYYYFCGYFLHWNLPRLKQDRLYILFFTVLIRIEISFLKMTKCSGRE